MELDSDNIADVVSIMTGIPISKVAESESKKLMLLSDKLSESIIGQEKAINSLSKAIRRTRVGLKSPVRPIGVFLFLGPTGVGKTELAKVLAKYLFTNKNSLVKVDMSEFGERFSVSRLIGAPPGYVGYDEGGELTEKVRRNPYSVVLLDEIEKAHPDLFNILLQVFDEGVLTDGLGRKIDFRNTIIIMTSNMGTKQLKKRNLGFSEKLGSSIDYSEMKEMLLGKVKEIFPPELLNRIDESIVFHSLTQENVFEIIDLQLKELINNLDNIGLKLTLAKTAKKLISKKGYDPENGVRPLRREIQKCLVDPISEMLLTEEINKGTIIKVKVLKNQLKFDFVEKRSSKSRTGKLTSD